jgi:Ca2+-dependent lipid-binding protein
MVPYTTSTKQYNNIYDEDAMPKINVHNRYKSEKMHFWNKKLPLLLSKSQRLVANTNTDIRTNYFVQETNSWVLISICIVLAALAISFLVGYCRTRRQLIQILTQNGVPIANRMV